MKKEDESRSYESMKEFIGNIKQIYEEVEILKSKIEIANRGMEKNFPSDLEQFQRILEKTAETDCSIFHKLFGMI